ncbi:MAG TPA: hypothetical protein VNR63_04285 [Gaiellaceae bacterium]|nr:hypothetical protein [Gaiellaceae bacterium]
MLAVGSRTSEEILYPASELAQSYNAGAATETSIPRGGDVEYDRSWL